MGIMPRLNINSTKVRVAAVLLIGGIGLSGCATRGYVDEQIAVVNGRITTVETRVQDAVARADAAAQTANAAAAEARAANQRVDQLTGRVDRLEQMPMRTPRN
jgi:outer membrane murein-binding lipoprotein Lpp